MVRSFANISKFAKALVLFGALNTALSSPVNAKPVEAELFPETPISLLATADPDIPKTEIKPSMGLESSIITNPIEDLASYVSIAKTLPLLSLDFDCPKKMKCPEKLLSFSLIASGQLKFPDAANINYKGRLELWANSPALENSGDVEKWEKLRLYLAGGIEKYGLMNVSGLEKKTMPQLASDLQSGINSYNNIFADVYLVSGNIYSDQFAIFRSGFGNLLDSHPDFHISAVLELPSILLKKGSVQSFDLLKNDPLKDFKISPYISVYFGFPLKYPSETVEEKDAYGLIGQIGIKASGKTGKSAILYAEADYKSDKFTFFTGSKFNL